MLEMAETVAERVDAVVLLSGVTVLSVNALARRGAVVVLVGLVRWRWPVRRQSACASRKSATKTHSAAMPNGARRRLPPPRSLPQFDSP